jgi:hypothetical protein
MDRLFFIGLFLWARIASGGTVDAARYYTFWSWAGVKAQPALESASTVYVLQGQIEAAPNDDTQVRFIAQRSALPASLQPELWLVYRAHTLRWTPRVEHIILAQRARLRATGRKIVGIQIDFDAATRHLQDYVAFLEGLRARLPVDCRLSITGLLDWSSRIDTSQVNRLRHVVDEVVVQTYQGRRTIDRYEAYLPRVGRLQLPYRIGLIQGGEWDAPPYLARSPWFRGYVVFLRNG